MKLFLSILTPILAVVVAGVAVFAALVVGDRNDLQEELAAVEEDLASVQGELGDTMTTLSLTQTELADTQDTLAETQADLGETQATLADTQDELADTNDELNDTRLVLYTAQNDLDDARDDLDAAEEELADMTDQYWVVYETLLGLGITLSWSPDCDDVALVDNPDAVNPTWAELRAFLAEDQTEQHDYILDIYDCSQFSRDLHDRAEAAGIRCAEVQVYFSNLSVGHALNAFVTTDYGLVYVDCTEAPDKIARLKADYTFRAVPVSAVSIAEIRSDAWWASLSSYYYMPADTGGQAVVMTMNIYW